MNQPRRFAASPAPEPGAPSTAVLALLREAGSLVEAVPPQELPGVLGEARRLTGVLDGRLLLLASSGARANTQAEDRLLGVQEASARLGIAVSTLYKKADEYPFTVRQLPGRLQFSEQGLVAYIRAKTGL